MATSVDASRTIDSAATTAGKECDAWSGTAPSSSSWTQSGSLVVESYGLRTLSAVPHSVCTVPTNTVLATVGGLGLGFVGGGGEGMAPGGSRGGGEGGFGTEGGGLLPMHRHSRFEIVSQSTSLSIKTSSSAAVSA
jgi:hypothetical protein